MAHANRRTYGRVEIIVPALYLGGVISALVGIISVAVTLGRSGTALLFCGFGAIAFGQLLELLTEIADHLAAIRGQVGKGVFGLLG